MTTRTIAALGGAIALLGVSGTVFAMGMSSSRLEPAHTFQSSVHGTNRGGSSSSSSSSDGMMGGGMMGGGMMGGGSSGSRGMMGTTDARLVNRRALTALVHSGSAGAVIHAAANTVRYTTSAVTLVALASPHGKPNMTWEIDGLVNPTITVPAGAHITVHLVNTDWGYMHGFELTTTPPPYPYMSMMGIANNFLVMPLPERTTENLATARFYARTASFTLAGGTYYYLCPVPGHAQQGMYGRLIVQS